MKLAVVAEELVSTGALPQFGAVEADPDRR
jgi:hypothetical protein